MATKAVIALIVTAAALVVMVGAAVMLVRESRPPKPFYRDAQGKLQRSWWYPGNWWIWGFLSEGLPMGLGGGFIFVLAQWLQDSFGNRTPTLPALIEVLPALSISNYGGKFLVAVGVLALAARLGDRFIASARTVTGAILRFHLEFALTIAALRTALWELDGGTRMARGTCGEGLIMLYALAATRALPYVIHVARQRGSLISNRAAWIIMAWAGAAVALLLAADQLLLRLRREELVLPIFVAFLAGGFVGVLLSYPQEPNPEAPEKEPFQLPPYARAGVRKLIGGGTALVIGGFIAANAPPGVFYPWMVVLAIAGGFFTLAGIGELFGGTWKAYFNPAPTLPNKGQKGRANFGNKRDLMRMGALANDD